MNLRYWYPFKGVPFTFPKSRLMLVVCHSRRAITVQTTDNVDILPMRERTLDLREAAAFLRMVPAALRIKSKAGLIPGAKPGKKWVFLESDLSA